MLTSSFTTISAALLWFIAPTAAASNSTTSVCNNSPLLCNRNYNNITHMGAHDAAFLRDSSTGFSTAGNQFYNATVALSAGIRLIQAQVHNLNGALELCHTSCSLLDGGPLEPFLSGIKTWMDANPSEVVTLLFVNSDNMAASNFGSAFTSSGLSEYGYTPSSTTSPISTWPSLETLITANTRLITFIADITYDNSYPYLLNEFDFVFETAFDVTSLSGFNCTQDRPSGSTASESIASGSMGLINHFADTAAGFGITIPDETDIGITNSPAMSTTGALGAHGSQCKSQWGIKPQFILVDFWNVGPAIQTADTLNGITAVGRTNISTDASSTTTNGANSVGDGPWGHAMIAGVAMAGLALGNILFL